MRLGGVLVGQDFFFVLEVEMLFDISRDVNRYFDLPCVITELIGASKFVKFTLIAITTLCSIIDILMLNNFVIALLLKKPKRNSGVKSGYKFC